MNARTTLLVREKYGSLDSFLWSSTESKQIVNAGATNEPVKTALSKRLAKECKNEGFQFIGSTVAYALMQAIGMMNGHEIRCFRERQIGRA